MKVFQKDIRPPFDYRTLFKYLPQKYRLKVGVALGSGGARGLTHLGVLNVLSSLGIDVEFISGTSVGALVGAFMAAKKLNALKEFAASLTRKESLKLADLMFPTSGLIEGRRIEQFLRKLLGTVRIEDLPIPFACVATDFYTGREVILKSGDLVTAVRASISIPGVFKPVPMDGMLLVDGGVVNPVPVQVVRDLGAEFIIAVDISPEIAKKMTIQQTQSDQQQSPTSPGRDEHKLPNIFDIIMGSIAIMESQVVDMRLKTERPDIVVKPQVEDMGTYDFHLYQEGMDRGESATRQVISKIRRYFSIPRTLPPSIGSERPSDGLLT